MKIVSLGTNCEVSFRIQDFTGGVGLIVISFLGRRFMTLSEPLMR